MEKTNERLRNLSWEDYGIEKERYRELKHFCLQYKGKKKKASSIDYNTPTVSLESSGGHTGKISKPVEDTTIKHMMRQEKNLRDCRMIEEAAMWAAAAGGFERSWKQVLTSVVENVNYDSILARDGFVPWNRTDFYAVRRAFFHSLDEKQMTTHDNGSQ